MSDRRDLARAIARLAAECDDDKQAIAGIGGALLSEAHRRELDPHELAMAMVNTIADTTDVDPLVLLTTLIGVTIANMGIGEVTIRATPRKPDGMGPQVSIEHRFERS